MTASKDKIVTVYDRDGQAHAMSEANALDMILHKGWHLPKDEDQPPVNLCEACIGSGTSSDGEVCWHCEGERIDPCM